MSKLMGMKRVLAAAVAMLAFGSAPVLAQTHNPKSLPVISPEPDQNGVDLIFGTFATPSPFEAASPGSRNLRLKYFFNGRHVTHNLSIYIDEKAYEAPPDEWGYRYVTLHLGGTAKQFECVGTAVCNQVYKPDGGTLSRNTADVYTYQDEKGVIYEFFSPKKWNDLSTYYLTAHVNTITYPDGEKLTFSPLNSVSVNGATTRVTDTVTSNLGYTLAVWTDANTIPNYNYQTTIPGYNWLGLTGTPRNARLSRSGVDIANINTQQTISGTNNVNMVIAQQDTLNRSYRIDLRADVFSSCSLYADYTYHKPIKVTSPGGVVTEILYNPAVNNGAPFNSGGGNPFPVKNVIRGANTWTYSWGATNSITDPSSGVRSIETRGFPSALYSGPSEGCAYPPADRGVVDRSSDELSRPTQFAYDVYERPSKATLPQSNGFDYEYDARGNVTKITRFAKPGSGLANQIIYQASFSASCANLVTCNKPLWTKDANGNQTDFTYDAVHGGYSTVTLPPAANGIRRVITYTYAPYSTGNGTLSRLVQTSACILGTSCVNTADEERTVTSYWSGTFLPESIVHRSGDGSVSATTSYVYDVAGRPTQVTDPNGNTTYFRYDIVGRMIGKILPPVNGAHRAERTNYNDDDQVTSIEKGTVTGPTDTAWAGFSTIETTTNSYDSLGHKIKMAQSTGGATYLVIQYSYDAENRLECTAVRMNPAIFGSLPASACTPGTMGSDGPDRITKNVYDTAGQLVQVRKAVGTSLEQAYTTYSYTPNGKQEHVVDANGNKAVFLYDGYDRQAQWQFPSADAPPLGFNPSTPATALASAGAVNTNDREEYGYDANGNRTSLRKRDGRTFTYTYDALDRMTAKIVPDACVAGYVCTNVPASATRDVYYSYDLRGLQTAARFDSASGTDAVTSGYDALGRLTSSATTMGGTSRALGYQYDAGGNRTRVTHPDGVYLQYNRDALGRIESIAVNGTTGLVQMQYNAQGVLSEVKRGLTGGVWGAPTSYSYDGLSRLTALTHDVSNAYDVTYGFGFNPANQLVSQTRNNDSYGYTGYLNVNRGYVRNGLNQYSSAGPAAFTYDANGNLISDGTNSFSYDPENRMVTASGGWVLTYDPLGRLWQNTPGGTDGSQMLWDRDELVDEYGLTGTHYSRQVHGDDEDDPLAMFAGSGTTSPNYYLADHEGSIVGATDAGGNVTKVLKYDEYGIQTGNQGRFQYTGQIWLPLGMYYYKARMYSPTLGRFLQTDPVGYDDQINLYTYVGNDPINMRDPDGTFGDPCTPKARICIQGSTDGPSRGPGSNIVRRIEEDPGVLIDGVAVAIDVATVPSGEGAVAIGVRRALRDELRRDARRVAEQRARRAERRERQSREGPDGAVDAAGNPQKPSGEGYRDREQANRGPSGDRPQGPDRRNNRERNVGVDEEHSRRPKGQQGPRY